MRLSLGFAVEGVGGVRKLWLVSYLDSPVAVYKSEQMAMDHANQLVHDKDNAQYAAVPLLTTVPTAINCDNELGDMMPLDENGWPEWDKFWSGAL